MDNILGVFVEPTTAAYLTDIVILENGTNREITNGSYNDLKILSEAQSRMESSGSGLYIDISDFPINATMTVKTSASDAFKVHKISSPVS